MILRALLLLAWELASAYERPEGCPEERWTTSCSGSFTCESLAAAGFVCGSGGGGVGTIDGCTTPCASPCCISTTTTTKTTRTSTETTMTLTSTITKTTVTTVTATESTVTSTSSSTSSTATPTTTTTLTTTDSTTDTVTMTHSTTSVTDTMATSAETTATHAAHATTGAADIEGPFRRLTIRIKVTDVEDDTSYVTDDRVSDAYRETMHDIIGLPEEMIVLQMVVNAPGNLTVSYILNFPEAEAEQSIKEVKESLEKETAASFNSKLQEHIDALAPGVYTQKVLSVEAEEEQAVGVSFAMAWRRVTMSLVVAASAIFF